MKTDFLREFLSNFKILTKAEMDIIYENTTVKAFKKGTILLKEGQVATNCYAVLKGCVREYYLIDGEEKSTAFFTEQQPVNSFTSYALQRPSKRFLECIEDSVLTVGTESLEKEMCRRIPRLTSIIRDEVEKEAGKTQDAFALFMTSSPEQRYLNLLEDRPELLNRVPQHQIASYLGIKPESLSRIRKRILVNKK
jgi:CRP-like cAMP-binding protein